MPRLAFALALSLLTLPAMAQEKTPILLDTDIGSDVDDAFALGLALSSPELDLRGVTTVSGNTMDRAILTCRFLTHTGHRDIPVAAGAEPQPKQDLSGQYQYRYHPAPIFNRTSKPAKQSAVEFLYETLKAEPGKITLCAVGPLTNVARLLTDHPDSKTLIKRIAIMGGSVRVGYNNKAPSQLEWNIKLDPAAARTVFTSGVPVVMAPLDATTMLKLEGERLKRLFAPYSLLTMNLQSLYQMWDQPVPTLYDLVAVTLCHTEKFCKMEDLCIEVDDKGMTREAKGKPNARVAVGIDKDAYLDFVVERLAKAMPTALPKEPGNRTKLIQCGPMPNRVHAFEDFETDIEKRWWMSGKAEKKNIPEGSTRACRAILTQDFDDRQGEMKTLYQAVIFNPVPGPPMGKNPRLSFRYFLKGADTMRVQIYSLTNGYHRYLSLAGLPQGSWQSGCVDMTQVRRPDGTGGPLGEDERIDDIQFYVDPRAELLIDDIVLYDEAVPGETRPFPQRIHYTGLFDTGKHGKEWMGQFEIVPKSAPEKWKAARSVLHPETKEPYIHLDFKGQRPLGKATALFLRYHLTGADTFRAALQGKDAGQSPVVVHAKQGGWQSAVVDLSASPLKAATGLSLLLPRGAELLLDDVLLYEPGR